MKSMTSTAASRYWRHAAVKALEDENCRLKRLPAESMQNEESFKDLLGRNV
jgi:hypothetical protein